MYSRLLVLIDADNTSDSYWPGISRTLQTLGKVHRIIAARNARGAGWKGIAGVELETLPYKVKNGADFYLAVRFGELLAEKPDALVVVTRDADFAALLSASRLARELPSMCLLPLKEEEAAMGALASAADSCLLVPAPTRLAPGVPAAEPRQELPCLSPSGATSPLAAALQVVMHTHSSSGDWIKTEDLRTHLHNQGFNFSWKRVMDEFGAHPQHFELASDRRTVRLRRAPVPSLQKGPNKTTRSDARSEGSKAAPKTQDPATSPRPARKTKARAAEAEAEKARRLPLPEFVDTEFDFFDPPTMEFPAGP